MPKSFPLGYCQIVQMWCRLGDSNTRPTHYECVALPAELRRPGCTRDSAKAVRSAAENTHPRPAPQPRNGPSTTGTPGAAVGRRFAARDCASTSPYVPKPVCPWRRIRAAREHDVETADPQGRLALHRHGCRGERARFRPLRLAGLGSCAGDAWVVAFFRDPERVAPPGDNLILSPADGRLLPVARAAPPAGAGAGDPGPDPAFHFHECFQRPREPEPGQRARSRPLPIGPANSSMPPSTRRASTMSAVDRS